MKTRQRITVAIAALVASASLAFIAWAYISSRTQGWNMARATSHIAVIQPSIRADVRFQNVELLSYTSDNGCLLVRGYVGSDQALNDLRRIIDTSRPPVFTKFSVFVLPDEPNPK